MNYEVECKNDMLTGAELIVKIPEDELDKKALNTIHADMPSFLIPFHYVCVDREVRFIYQIGRHCKLQYMTGSREVREYAQLWTSVLSPLVECKDWFMQPDSFLLDAQYLYYDKDSKAVRYIYIPSVLSIAGHNKLKELAADISKLICVDDAQLENKVLRAIMKNFEPNDLLKLLRATMTVKKPDDSGGIVTQAPAQESKPAASEETQEINLSAGVTDEALLENHPIELYGGMEHASKPQESTLLDPNDIIIEIPEKGSRSEKKEKREKKKKEKREKKKKNSKSSRSENKDLRKDKKAGGMFGRKRKSNQLPVLSDISEASAANTFEQAKNEPRCESGEEAWSLGLPKNSNTPAIITHFDSGDETESIVIDACETRLRYIGRLKMPLIINVDIKEGGIFSIGRYDAAVGRQQSSFEFDKKAKAISRRHAAIERTAGGYNLIDLSSGAGTFINYEKLPPNTPCKLSQGDRIAFGNSGADYIWEP